MSLVLYAITLENEYFKTSQEYFWNIPFIFAARIFFLWAEDVGTRKKERKKEEKEYGAWLFLKKN